MRTPLFILKSCLLLFAAVYTNSSEGQGLARNAGYPNLRQKSREETRSVDLLYEAGCVSNRDTLIYNYTLVFGNNSRKSVWISPIYGIQAYKISVYNEEGLELSSLSSSNKETVSPPAIITTSKQILIKAWVVGKKDRSPILINWINDLPK